MKHSKGPWRVKTWGAELNRNFSGEQCLSAEIFGESDSKYIGNIQLEGALIDDPELNEGWANARLVCAAPELLEALEHIQKEISSDEFIKHSKDAINKVNEAIKKAKGE